MTQRSATFGNDTGRMAVLAAATIAAAVCWQSGARAQCAEVHSMYRDLETWVHKPGPGAHYFEVEVTLINPATSGGSHYYTAWSRGCLAQGVEGYGQCYLTTNGTLSLLFSDRTAAIPATQVPQPFTVGKRDTHLVALDMVGNRVISKSITWKYQEVYENLTRKGNLIQGVAADGSMIVLNLRPKQTSGPNEPRDCRW